MSEAKGTGQDRPEERLPFVGPSERRAKPEPPPLPPAKRVGFAVVGLGRLSLEAVLPALAMSKLCRLAAVMTLPPVDGVDDGELVHRRPRPAGPK